MTLPSNTARAAPPPIWMETEARVTECRHELDRTSALTLRITNDPNKLTVSFTYYAHARTYYGNFISPVARAQGDTFSVYYNALNTRQCVIVLTTNESQYLKDSTGNRRFWPVAVKSIDIEGLRQARDQLFAEAVHRFQAGEPYWPTADFEREHIAGEQEARREIDAWSESIERFTECRTRVTVQEIATELLHIAIKEISPKEARRITAILAQIGFEANRTSRQRYWTRSAK